MVNPHIMVPVGSKHSIAALSELHYARVSKIDLRRVRVGVVVSCTGTVHTPTNRRVREMAGEPTELSPLRWLIFPSITTSRYYERKFQSSRQSRKTVIHNSKHATTRRFSTTPPANTMLNVDSTSHLNAYRTPESYESLTTNLHHPPRANNP